MPKGPSGQTRKGLIILGLLVAGCATEAVSTPEQARTVALSSVCAKADVVLDPNETLPTQWVVERKGDRWYVWLPHGPDARFQGEGALKAAWINARDGKIASCDGRYK